MFVKVLKGVHLETLKSLVVLKLVIAIFSPLGKCILHQKKGIGLIDP